MVREAREHDRLISDQMYGTRSCHPNRAAAPIILSYSIAEIKASMNCSFDSLTSGYMGGHIYIYIPPHSDLDGMGSIPATPNACEASLPICIVNREPSRSGSAQPGCATVQVPGDRIR
jgi:hypothetical protein